jgi:sialate O-acetylesterase
MNITGAQKQTASSREALKQGVYGGFSATAFYFGRRLHRELSVPIAPIDRPWGGTVAEAWTGFEALEKMESMKDRSAVLSTSPQPSGPANPNITTDLHNGAGLTAVPFRTDDSPGITKGRR